MADDLPADAVSASTPTDTSRLEDGGIVKDDKYWLEDGNIVIIASDSVAFRVYKGLLARASPVFQDMFATTHPDEGQTVDGAPVVRVSEQSQELSYFLSTLLDPSYETDLYRTKTSYAFLAVMARIAHKYQVDSALTFASERLVKFFCPGSPWVKSVNTWTNRWDTWLQTCNVSIELKDSIDAVDLFRLLEISETFPFTLYLCCLCDPLQLRNGVLREDKSIARLTDEDYSRCVKAMVPLTWECRAIVQRVFNLPHTWAGSYVWLHSCTENGLCKDVIKQMHNQYAADSTIYPLSDLFVRLDCRNPVPKAYSALQRGLCASCRKQLLARSVEMCAEMLANLPKFFDLEQKKAS